MIMTKSNLFMRILHIYKKKDKCSILLEKEKNNPFSVGKLDNVFQRCSFLCFNCCEKKERRDKTHC